MSSGVMEPKRWIPNDMMKNLVKRHTRERGGRERERVQKKEEGREKREREGGRKRNLISQPLVIFSPTWCV